MALIKCPECQKEISDTVDSCPNCGYRMTVKSSGNGFVKAICYVTIIISIFLSLGGIPFLGWVPLLWGIGLSVYISTIYDEEKLSFYRRLRKESFVVFGVLLFLLIMLSVFGEKTKDYYGENTNIEEDYNYEDYDYDY